MPPKRKRQQDKPRPSSSVRDEELHSDESDNEDQIAGADGMGNRASSSNQNGDGIEEDDFFETPDEKRVRLAKQYLSDLGVGTESTDAVAEKLQRDADLHARKVQYNLGQEMRFGEVRFLKGHLYAPTSVCVSYDESVAFTGGKDCAIIRWDIETGKKTIFPGKRKDFDCGGHFESVQGVALCEDAHLLLSGGNDKVVRLWDTRMCGAKCVDTLKGHTGAITSVCMEPGPDNQLLTASMDKTLKVWSLGMRSYLDTLYGHTSGVNCMDVLQKDRPLTGGDDKTCRMWKVSAETHLLFGANTGPVDSVTVMNAQLFAAGSQDGSISLMSLASRKPLCIEPTPHEGHGVSALACVRYSDALFSGSCNGQIKAWQSAKAEGEKRGKGRLIAGDIAQLKGCVNAMCVSRSGRFLAVAVGKEPKNGRWMNLKEAKNGLAFIPLQHSQAGQLS
eukprot:GDKI01001042.1.p1 GENE.GDKI01001042.1~~GDKI01001042.1.p1  ORF type:complete len:458 (-),score=133.03 GDKI01001042.1:147-1487(-)